MNWRCSACPCRLKRTTHAFADFTQDRIELLVVLFGLSAMSSACDAEEANFFAGKSIQMVGRLRRRRRLRSLRPHGGAPLVEAYSRQSDIHTAEHAGRRHPHGGELALQRRAEGRHRDRHHRAELGGRSGAGRARHSLRRRKFNWIGNPIVDNLVTLSWSSSGLATLEDVKSKGGLFCGSTGGGPTTVFPRVINQLLGTQIKVIAGYPGQSAVNIAMERGEVNCIGGTTWSSVKATMRPHAGSAEDQSSWSNGAPPKTRRFPPTRIVTCR